MCLDKVLGSAIIGLNVERPGRKTESKNGLTKGARSRTNAYKSTVRGAICQGAFSKENQLI